jgi:F-type H+-transporting ATPase subunit b
VSVDLSVLWVIVFVLVLVGILNALFFEPLLNVMDQRSHAVSSARALAERAAADAAAAAQQFEQRTTVARGEVHRAMEEARRAAQARRAELLAATRDDVHAQLDEARDRLAADTAVARTRLEQDADRLGAFIVERVLGRPVR